MRLPEGRATEFAIPRVSGNAFAIIPESRHEVWHSDPLGDWRLAYFDVAFPARELRAMTEGKMLDVSRERIRRMFEETVRNWARMLHNEGWEPTTKPHLRPQAFFVPEPECEDKRRFFIAARVKRTRAELLPLDTVAALSEQGPVDGDQMMRDFFNQMSGLTENGTPEEIGKTAKEDATTLRKKAAQERQRVAESDAREIHKFS